MIVPDRPPRPRRDTTGPPERRHRNPEEAIWGGVAPTALLDLLAVGVVVHEAGDVRARTLVRVEEARESARLIRRALETLPAGPLAVDVPPLPPFAPAFSLVEGWRGAIIHWVMAGTSGALERVKVFDPSFLNWPALSYALINNIVPDFPLCNKSFNQSYAGNDL